jgi:hypothetical protein
MENENDILILAYYADAEAAEAAAEDLKGWDKANDDIKLGAIGVITLDEDSGSLKVDEIGQRNTRAGALWGTAIGAGLGLITGGIGVIPGMALGAALGGGVGALDHKSLGMSDHDVALLKDNLKDGGAALGVMCDDFEVAETEAKIIVGGGVTAYYNVPGGTAQALAAAAAAQKVAGAAVDETMAELPESRVVEVNLPEADAETVTAVGAMAAAGNIDAADAVKLHEAGVDKASALLAMGATPEGRGELAQATGIEEVTLLKAVQKLDLMRIKGVGEVYAELLQTAGVESVPDLARRNPANLNLKLADVNESAKVSDVVPSEETLADWIGQAQDLPRLIEY